MAIALMEKRARADGVAGAPADRRAAAMGVRCGGCTGARAVHPTAQCDSGCGAPGTWVEAWIVDMDRIVWAQAP